MRNLLAGIIAGLMLGTLGTWAYENYAGLGPKLVEAQDNLTSTHTEVDATQQHVKDLKNETDAESAQVQQLTARNDELKRQVGELKNSAPDSAAAAAPNPMANLIKAQMTQQQDQKLLLLKTRLNLTPEQEAAVKAAMDEQSKRTEAMTAKMFQGGKIDPQAVKDMGSFKTVDQTLKDILTPDQKTIYAQMQDDEKKTNAETMATFEMNQSAPMLQLSDTQKDQVYTALYQLQIDSQNPDVIKKMTTNPTDPTSILDAQAQAKEDALSKILTPQQLAAYHQQAQSQLQMQKAMMQRFAPAMKAATAAP